MKNAWSKGAGILFLFFITVLIVALISNRHYPQLAVIGEASVGTWLSGALLICAATLSLITFMQTGKVQWVLFAVFFFILAADERFMFHEHLKRWLIFTFHLSLSAYLVYELPVIIAACIGAYMAYLLWTQLGTASRVFLFCATLLGITSVVIDVLTAGVLLEDLCKLFAELLLAISLLKKVAEK